MKVEVVSAPQIAKGKSPHWDCEQGALYWVDSPGRTVFRYRPSESQLDRWKVPKAVGSIVPMNDGSSALVALEDGIYILDLVTGRCRFAAASHELGASTSLSEGRTDPGGRFVVGAFARNLRDSCGSLLSFRPGSNVLAPIADDLIFPNGPCWSLDGKTLFVADSIRRVIFAYEYDNATGEVGARREFSPSNRMPGVPCGMTVDAEDHLWVAMCHSQSLARFRPDGSVSMMVRVPPTFPSSLTFGGPLLDDLYVTTQNPLLNIKDSPMDGLTYVLKSLSIQGRGQLRFQL